MVIAWSKKRGKSVQHTGPGSRYRSHRSYHNRGLSSADTPLALHSQTYTESILSFHIPTALIKYDLRESDLKIEIST